MNFGLSPAEIFGEERFLQKLAAEPTVLSQHLQALDFDALFTSLLPITERVSCSQVLSAVRPLLDRFAPEPEGGWLPFIYQFNLTLLYPHQTLSCTDAQRNGALCFLQFFQAILDAERQALPFDPWLDFAFCTDAELADSSVAAEYRLFLRHFREEYAYELLRLSQEVTSFRSLAHIAGVHHVAMTVGRAFKSSGGFMDLALMSGAAAAHDIGKFGCRPGERVPYLHYYYSNQWCEQRGLPSIGRIAANHSVWDLELENLSSESLILVYSDFRVKQVQGSDGREAAQLFSLQDAYDVILNKLDNVDAAKRNRYEYVYVKLQDFENYLISLGVDVTLGQSRISLPMRRDAALMTPNEAVHALRHAAVAHNIQLMHRLSHERLFVATLEAARGERDPIRIRAYLSVFEKYFTYWNIAQKEQTLEFLYELLLLPDGDIRLQAAHLMGQILAKFLSGYRKELPADAPPHPHAERPFQLWESYLERLLSPDQRLTPRQISMIRYQAKTVANTLLENCAPADTSKFAVMLFRYCQNPQATDAEAAFALLDTVQNIPVLMVPDMNALVDFSIWWLEHGEVAHKAAALRLFQRLLPSLPKESAAWNRIAEAAAHADCCSSTPLLFLQAQLCTYLNQDVSALWAQVNQADAVSGILLDNLKSATPWILKAVGVEYLCNQAEHGMRSSLLLIAAHFANLIKASENVIVRRMAGAALLTIAPMLTPERRNEIAVELCKALESGQTEISQYIPTYLGQFVLWLPPRELDESLDHLVSLLASANTGVVSLSLSTIGSMLEYYSAYGERFHEESSSRSFRYRRMTAQLLKGLASCEENVRQISLHVIGDGLFASDVLSHQEKTDLFTLIVKKFLFLIGEQPERELTFFYTAAALSRIYRFIVHHHVKYGPFLFTHHNKAAFFPGTFDPFSLSHKAIVRAIRNLGFEVYLAIDEFSWSKKAQPSLIRRQIVSMSIADAFDVYLFPHDIPVNLATPADLKRLREVFSGWKLYLAVGSDVVANASSYKTPPTENSVHSLNHIVFRRSSAADGREFPVDLSVLQGEVIQLQLPTHLESISSTRIRENIDYGRDISNLIDPTVQDYIVRNSLYLREPQYKQLIQVSYLDFSFVPQVTPALLEELRNAIPAAPGPAPQDSVCILRDTNTHSRILGFLTSRTVNSSGLYAALGSENLADYVRVQTAGRIQLLTGLYTVPNENYDIGQLLLTEVLSRAMAEDCSYAVWQSANHTEALLDLLERQGFVRAEIETDHPLLIVDMRSPVAVMQNTETTLKEPFSSDSQVLHAIQKAHYRFQRAICNLYPGNLVLTLNAEVIYHRLVRKITALNGVPTEPTQPRVLGPMMCVPFGKILRGNAVPNTVTKTIHTDKVFSPDLKSFTISSFPGYAPLESQVRMVHSFRRPVILVDDLLHSGNRLNALDPLARRENLDIYKVLVGLLSGKGRDLMTAKGRDVDGVYFVPDLQAWFVESTMYPFIGGDTVDHATSSVPGLTPAVNMILPYALPGFYKGCDQQAIFRFSQACIQNSRDILLALETAYRDRYSRNLTLSHLNEAVVLPLAPDKGQALRYDPNMAASYCLENDLQLLLRMEKFLK